MSFSKGWILIYPFIITHRLIHDFMRESCQHLIQSLVKSLGKNVRIPRYELLGTNDRVTMAVRGASSVRTKFHIVPLELPPPPGISNLFTYEHSNCSSTTKK